jgi:hypothetical protein
MKVSGEIKSDNYDTYLTLLDTALTLKNVADIIGDGQRGILKVLEDVVKRMDRMEEMLDTMRSRGRGWLDSPFH